ncbi:MAG: hypothetical protein JNN15_09965 [Blastocatellia bacterium]|nr:hypothetical protein [Blastocatellia bacterium]
MTSLVQEYKIKASILLKTLRSSDLEKAAGAAERFNCLPHLTNLSPRQILLQKSNIKRKHALTVIAFENEKASWADFKHHLERLEVLRTNRNYTDLYPRRCAGFINEWYASYETARKHLEQVGGYLLPYKNHFFICKADYIKALGLDPEDPDWNLISSDWVKPSDIEAWHRLNVRLQQLSK